MAYTDIELEALMTDVESDLVERKAAFDGGVARAVRQAICAFANDLPDRRRPGVVFVGVQDDGTPTGLEINDALLLKLAHCKTDGNILPLPAMTVGKHTLRGADVAVVTVAPADSPPVRFQGRIWIRVGPRRAVASAQDERILNEKRRHGDAPFDARPVHGATLADLDLPRFQYLYLPRAFDAEVLARNDRTLEERLAATKMIAGVADPTPTVLGVLMLSPRPMDFVPGAYVQFLRFAGPDRADPIIDSARFDGPVADAMRDLDSMLRGHIRTSVEIGSGRRRSAAPPIRCRRCRSSCATRSCTAPTKPPTARCRWPGSPTAWRSSARAAPTATSPRKGRRAGSARLPQPEPGRRHARRGLVQRYGVWNSARATGAARQQPGGAGVRGRRAPCALHRARAAGLAGQRAGVARIGPCASSTPRAPSFRKTTTASAPGPAGSRCRPDAHPEQALLRDARAAAERQDIDAAGAA